MIAVIVFAHGSPVPEANDGVAEVARQAARQMDAGWVTAAFLDSAPPTLGQAVAEAHRRGATRVIVMPYFLTLGLHLRRDLPQLVDEQRARFPQLDIVVTESLEGYAGMAEAIASRVRAAVDSTAAPPAQSAHECDTKRP